MAQALHVIQPPEPPPAPGGYVETETARDIARSLNMALATRGLTMIAGRSGVGKSTAVDRFCETLPDREGGGALRLTITSGQGSPWHVATGLMRPWGTSPREQGQGIETAFDFLRDRLTSEEYSEHDYVMIVVDEAQYLDHRTRKSHYRGAAFEWLRSLSEETDVPLAFVGDLALVDGIGLFPQLESRMRRPVILKNASATDVEAIAASYGVGGDLELRVLKAVARRAGGLRNVAGVLDMAHVFSGGEPIGSAHIGAAVHDLKLDKERGLA
ncbi:MAG: AAA family ATPase [Pseudomonadota bacterium]